MREDSFGRCNPLVCFVYFVVVLLINMISVNLIILCISLIGAILYGLWLNGFRALRFDMLTLLPMLIITAMINPLFNHRGATIIWYFKNGNPLTLESIIYGIVTGVVFIGVVAWFSCYNKIMTSDKFIYIFGRIIPAMSLILSMVLRFIPRLKGQLKNIVNSQSALGRDENKVKTIMRNLSILVTWALENSIDTADSMKARGYGLKGRTSFSLYQFDVRDIKLLVLILFLGICILVGGVKGLLYVRYYPTIYVYDINIGSVIIYSVYAVLVLLPTLMGISSELSYRKVKV